MAYLNVRERRIEAKVAYVGPDLSGKTTNFDRLRQVAQDPRIARVDAPSVGGQDLLSIAWQSPERTRFRDCDLLVKVVATHGAASGTSFDDVLGDADGVVLVADARPAAQPRNLECLSAVREALARLDRRALPLVVQVNKTDLPDAVPAVDVVAQMDAGALRHVAASATRGDGVVDTLEAALDLVVAAMMQREGEAGDGAERHGGIESPKHAEGHPLLAALRQVLRETVHEHVQEMEARVVARLEGSLDRIARSQERSEAAVAETRRLVASLSGRHGDPSS